ncbi:thiamine ABC transporter substrate-binding protein [Demequina sp. B12]|uniref:thiamine ABC transporter substrate-binding protein n=1 Tax=Demequina sp. B12 TaxID=2992757 RepID=UPI00237A1C58|nr:thiamine ABC transporter substrate-binding protein [Demequina sp. B12]MDE0572299.1 thiamine ABC transporter substrate-binding protein [Demequina sp. B12]
MRIMRTAAFAAATIATVTLAACTSDADAEPTNSATPTTSPTTSAQGFAGQSVTLVTHDSFNVPEEVLASFEEETGLTVEFAAPGDAGSLVNQLILTKDAPLGDVVFGVDNTFASRAVAEGVFADYTSSVPAAADADQYAVPGSEGLTAIDYSDVCLNYDLATFAGDDPALPSDLGALTGADYADMLSVSNPATSSPGLAFLLATIAEFGDEWETYWQDLADNGLRVTASWSDTYYTDFAAPNYGGDYPIVLSYASSPPFEVVDSEPTTAAMLNTCFRQVEYAGVLEGAENPEAAQAVIDWMLSDEFQAAIPENMYVYPVSQQVEIPAEWAEYAPLSDAPLTLDPQEISDNRDEWIDTWTSILLG